MVDSVIIERLHAAYDQVSPDEALRLDRVLQDVASGALEAELMQRLPASSFAVCVRSLTASVELDPSRPASDVAQSWARQIAAAMETRLAAGDVVVYGREIDAITDLAQCVGRHRGDSSRSWAWKQLGLLDRDRPPTSDDLVGILCRRSELIVGVLGSFRRPVDVPLRPDDWLRVSRSLQAMLGPNGSATPSGHQIGTGSAPADGRLAAGVTGLLAQFGVAAAEQSVGGERLLTAWRTADLAGRFAIVSTVLALAQPVSLGDRRVRAALDAALDEAAAADVVADPTTTSGDSQVEPERPGDDGPLDDAHLPDSELAERTTDDTMAEPAMADGAVRAEHDETDGAEDSALTIVDPVRTRFAGVFFLAHVVGELDLVDRHLQVAGHDAGELLARVLEQLTGIAWDDPAVATLAGIDDVDAVMASRMLEPADRQVTAAVATAVDDLHAWLVEHLETDDTTHRTSWNWVWRRDAAIESTPGWIEIELSVETADARIRRAGLDLDPGFVRWLGAVMRFRYV